MAEYEPAARAIIQQDTRAMGNWLHAYRNPNTNFNVETWSGRCILPPLALAMEEPGYHFQYVLRVLVEDAGVRLSDPYEIEDQFTRIRTNALTHLLVRWNVQKSRECRDRVLGALLFYGANANAPALYEVTFTGQHTAMGQPPPRTRELAALAGQGLSLMAFQMLQQMPVITPFHYITDLIENGHAQFKEEDPTGLFVKAVYMRGPNAEGWMECIMGFLCPEEPDWNIAGGLVAPGATAHGELRRIVQGMDPDSGMNILHVYVAQGKPCSLEATMQRLRMLRDVYGLDLCLPTADGRTLTALASAPLMRKAVKAVLKEEVMLRHRALALVQGLPGLPRETLYRLGRETGLPMVGAYELDTRLLPPGDPRRSRRLDP